MRATASTGLREHVGRLDRKQRRAALSAIENTADAYGCDAAIAAAEQSARATGTIPGAMLELAAARMASGGPIGCESPSDLDVCDTAINSKEKEAVGG